MPDTKPLPPKNKGSDTSNLPNLFESEVQDDSTTSKANLPNAKIYFDTDKVKINKNGKIEKKIELTVNAASKTAIQKIEKAGGKVTIK